ncbi:MAG: FAD:protein FMN transferase [Acidimicrobiia bacterium]|nr:FAD:protein FMN transferase [Acidimicrobiia bacterium]
MQRFEVLSTWGEHTFRAMGTTATLLLHGGSPAVMTWAEQELDRLENLWSRFRPGTDVARLNRGEARPVPVAPETIDVVEQAVALWQTTHGRFDPTVLRALEASGYDESFERVRGRPDAGARRATAAPAGFPALHFSFPGDQDESRPAPGCADIVVDRARATITLPPGTGLDLGGIGKGAAADLVTSGVLARGSLGVCVGLGGDIRCAGAGPDDGRWHIDVEDPFDEDRVLFTQPIDEGALVTSTVRFRRWRQRGIWRHHIIDPATGLPSTSGIVAAIVGDATAARAEALAKAALVAGRNEGIALLVRAGVTGCLVDDRGQATMIEHARHGGLAA